MKLHSRYDFLVNFLPPSWRFDTALRTTPLPTTPSLRVQWLRSIIGAEGAEHLAACYVKRPVHPSRRVGDVAVRNLVTRLMRLPDRGGIVASYPEIAQALGLKNHSTVITQMRRAVDLAVLPEWASRLVAIAQPFGAIPEPKEALEFCDDGVPPAPLEPRTDQPAEALRVRRGAAPLASGKVGARPGARGPGQGVAADRAAVVRDRGARSRCVRGGTSAAMKGRRRPVARAFATVAS